MKCRNGFVSNSSASSFTIYGWTEEDLSKHVAKLSPVFEGVELYIEEVGMPEGLKEGESIIARFTVTNNAKAS